METATRALGPSGVQAAADQRTLDPLQDAFVAAYARPFTSDKPFGPRASRCSKFDDPDKRELHDELLQMLHEVVAHTDASQRSVVIVPPGLSPLAPGREPIARATLAVIHQRRSPAFFTSVRWLCDALFARFYAAVKDELQVSSVTWDPLDPSIS